MTISVFGLGYVGAVTAGCLAEKGHRIIGVDVHEAKVNAINEGRSPIIEPELDHLMQRAKEHGRLSATTDASAAVLASEVSIVCVGTPSQPSGALDLRYVRKVATQIAEALHGGGSDHLLILRSTLLPGSTRQLANEFFGELLSAGRLRLFYCPEFLREGTAVSDFREPSPATERPQTPLPPAHL